MGIPVSANTTTRTFVDNVGTTISSQTGEPVIVHSGYWKEQSTQNYPTKDQAVWAFITADPATMIGSQFGLSDNVMLGLGILGAVRNPASIATNWRSVKKFGHTFSKHGEGKKITERLMDRAKGTGTDQGQWLDNDKAAEFLSKVDVDGPASIRIPSGLGQVIKPDGTILKADDWARVVPTETGFKTAFPIVPGR